MRRGAKLVSETLRAGEGGDVGGPADDAAMHGPPKRRESHAHDLEDDEDGGAQGPGTGNGAQKERVGIASMTDRNWVLGKISAVVEGGGHPAEYFTVSCRTPPSRRHSVFLARCHPKPPWVKWDMGRLGCVRSFS